LLAQTLHLGEATPVTGQPMIGTQLLGFPTIGGMQAQRLDMA
jgi:hypothetical protein